MSSPTPSPPPTVKAPVEVEDEAVVDVTATTPAELIVIALVSLDDPMAPASGMTTSPRNSTVRAALYSVMLGVVPTADPRPILSLSSVSS